MSQRARYRDFYDFYLITQSQNIDLDETVRLVQQKEIRKAISKASILDNWRISSAKRSDEIELVYYRQDIVDEKPGVESLLKSLPFDTLEPNSAS
jgi:hypothetical protein